MSLTYVLHLWAAYFRRNPVRRRRIPWAFLTKLLGFLTAVFGLLKVVLELWAQSA